MFDTIFMLEKDTLSTFFARISVQAALCNWLQAQEREALNEFFIGGIRDLELQRQLIKARDYLDNTWT